MSSGGAGNTHQNKPSRLSNGQLFRTPLPRESRGNLEVLITGKPVDRPDKLNCAEERRNARSRRQSSGHGRGARIKRSSKAADEPARDVTPARSDDAPSEWQEKVLRLALMPWEASSSIGFVAAREACTISESDQCAEAGAGETQPTAPDGTAARYAESAAETGAVAPPSDSHPLRPHGRAPATSSVEMQQRDPEILRLRHQTEKEREMGAHQLLGRGRAVRPSMRPCWKSRGHPMNDASPIYPGNSLAMLTAARAWGGARPSGSRLQRSSRGPVSSANTGVLPQA